MYRSFAVGASRTQLASMAVFLWACMALAAQAQKPVVIEDFERYEVGEVPQDWSTNKGRSLIPASPETMTPEHEYRIVRERGNQFVRATMRDYAYRLIRINGDTFDWNLHAYPVLRWRWRIHEVPVGAREDDKNLNDTAAAVYVTFDRDWLGRPKSIKYTYSSTLPVGTTASYGPLKVIVVGSAAEDDLNTWTMVERNVAEDYERLFGQPFDKSQPIGITLFSDADDVPDGSAMADFDDLVMLPRSSSLELTGKQP